MSFRHMNYKIHLCPSAVVFWTWSTLKKSYRFDRLFKRKELVLLSFCEYRYSILYLIACWNSEKETWIFIYCYYVTSSRWSKTLSAGWEALWEQFFLWIERRTRDDSIHVWVSCVSHKIFNHQWKMGGCCKAMSLSSQFEHEDQLFTCQKLCLNLWACTKVVETWDWFYAETNFSSTGNLQWCNSLIPLQFYLMVCTTWIVPYAWWRIKQ